MISLLPSLALLSSFLALVLCAFLLAVPSNARLANALLALFLFATAVDVSGWFIIEGPAFLAKVDDYKPVLAMLQMPAFAGFVWLNCFQRQALRALDALHVIPGMVVLGFVATETPMPNLRLIFEIQYAFYIVATIYALWRVQREITSQSVWRSPNWLWLGALVLTSLGAHSLFVFRTMLSARLSQDLKNALEVSAAALILIIMVSIALQALLNPRVFRGLDRIMAFATSEIGRPTSQDTRRLEALMKERKPYLDPELTISRLARQSGMTAKDLSAQINQRHGVHFFDFVNRYRVEHAKALLGDTDQSVTEVYLESGFNSKSSFNTAFRKHAGMTPSAYRKKTRNI